MYNKDYTNNIGNTGHSTKEQIYQTIFEIGLKKVLVNTLTRAHTFLICKIRTKIQI